MKKSITISIPEPCHEDWAKMTPTEKGKFCDVCTKEVFDFTKSSDEELIKRVQTGKNLCGRFNKSQLGREVKLERKSKNSLLPYAASLLLPLSILNTSEMNAQGGASIAKTHFTSLGIGSIPIKSIVTITGFVTDANNIPVSNAEVFVLETGESDRTGPDGGYKIVCTSGSTIFSKKGESTSDRIIVGTKNALIDLKLREVQLYMTVKGTTVGKIATIPTPLSCGLTVTTEEMVSVEAEPVKGDIEVQAVVVKVENTVPKTLLGQLGRPFVKEIKDETIPDKKEQDSLPIIITGTITDESNLPLPGANIIVKGTTQGIQSDFDGYYSIEVEANQTLVFSYLGYETKEILASNISNTIDLQMLSNQEFLGEIIILGGYSLEAEPAVNNPFNYEPPSYNAEREERIAQRKQAAKNEAAFKKIKIQRAKVQRQLKRSHKKKK